MDFFKDSQTNWKYILITVILAVLVGGGILWYAAKQEVPLTGFPEIKKPKEIQIPNTSIIYSKEICDSGSCEDAIWMANPKTGIKIPIIKTTTDEKITGGYRYYSINSLALSSNKERIAYTLEPLGNATSQLRIFNLITGEDKLLTSFKIGGDYLITVLEDGYNWAPDDKHIAVNYSVHIINQGEKDFVKIINTDDGKEVINLERPTYSDFMWLNGEELLYLAFQGTSPVDLTRIEAISLGGQKRIICEATDLKYCYLEAFKNGRIVFSLTEVNSVADWSKPGSGGTTTFWTMNREGKDLIQISESEFNELTKEPNIESLLSEELLSGYTKGSAYEKSLSGNSDWWLFAMNQVCPQIVRCFTPDDLFIINVKDKTSLIKIDENIRAYQGMDW